MPLNRKLMPTKMPSTVNKLAAGRLRIRPPRIRVISPLRSPQPQPLISRWARDTTEATAPSTKKTMPIAKLSEATGRTTPAGPAPNC